MAKAIIDVKDVWKIYTMGSVEVPALRGLTLTIKQGDFAVIMGPSGSGKSTLMHCIAGLDELTSGKVYIG
ncbi:ATP-binding cassette domain-containing protein, partial [Candidatus Woesearchaeota archaeon]|nr:ATP-binding cassette domain-containing protein [Candidatus Woesearchaeota archaeon]